MTSTPHHPGDRQTPCGQPYGSDTVNLEPEHATRLLHLLRDLHRLFEDAGGALAGAMDDYFDFAPASDTYAAATEIEVDALQEAIDAYNHPIEAHAG
jgi:hypothetical protein